MSKDNINMVDDKIENMLNQECQVCSALKVLCENLDENSDLSMYRTIIYATAKISPHKALNIAFELVENSIFPDKIVYELMYIINEYDYLVINNTEVQDNLVKCLENIICGYHQYTVETLLTVANWLEKLFAKGFNNIRCFITRIYNILPKEYINEKDFNIHRELMCVYTYNGFNFKAISRKLVNVLEKCKLSKRKYLYGEINYYRAVLDKLSNTKIYYKNIRCIDYACDAGYELAYILRDRIYTNVDFE